MAFLFFVFFQIEVNAATLLAKSFSQLVMGATLIVDARVIPGTRTSNLSGNSIFTCLDFEVNEYVKGRRPSSRLKLCFEGGIHSGLGVDVPGVRIPNDGERGIYFLENDSLMLSSPFVGWHQGDFVVTSEKGGTKEIVRLASKRVVTSVDVRAVATPGTLASEVATGVHIGRSDDVDGAMSVQGFKESIRQLLRD